MLPLFVPIVSPGKRVLNTVEYDPVNEPNKLVDVDNGIFTHLGIIRAQHHIYVPVVLYLAIFLSPLP